MAIYGIVWSGEKELKRHGVALVMDKQANRSWEAAGKECTQVDSRLMKMRFKTKTGYMTVVAAYAPTNRKDSCDDANEFYQKLGDMVNEIPKNDVINGDGRF